MLTGRNRYVLPIFLLLFLFSTYYLRSDIAQVSSPIIDDIKEKIHPETKEPYPKYKPTGTVHSWPIVDNFPLAAAAHSAAELPPIASWNQPPAQHVPENTPLFIGFTRNWRLLQQVVVSYITAGWPPEDIYVVENTGVMDSNRRGELTLQNPFFLNHTRLSMLGVNVLITPTLFTFAQLQNFYLWHSIEHEWTHYFWSHMDVVALSFEDQYATSHPTILPPTDPSHDYSDFPTIYKNCLAALRDVMNPKYTKPWAMRFFSYDRLALVNVASFKAIGGWDTLIPFYMTDCDMHARLEMEKYDIKEVPGGMIFDVASSMDDLLVLYRKKGTEASFKDPNAIEEELKAIAEGEKSAVAAGLDKEPSRKYIRDDLKEEASKKARSELAAVLDSAITSRTATITPNAISTWEEDTIFSSTFQNTIHVLDAMQNSKGSSNRGRNTWQGRQMGGKGEPFYRDAEGFEIGIQMTIEHGRAVFREKWGHRDCDIVAMGLKPADAWRVEHDWS